MPFAAWRFGLLCLTYPLLHEKIRKKNSTHFPSLLSSSIDPLRIFDGRGHFAKVFIGWIPLFLAGLCGLSRIVDYRHHWSDVLAGSILGTVVSIIGYICVYPWPEWTADVWKREKDVRVSV